MSIRLRGYLGFFAAIALWCAAMGVLRAGVEWKYKLLVDLITIAGGCAVGRRLAQFDDWLDREAES